MRALHKNAPLPELDNKLDTCKTHLHHAKYKKAAISLNHSFKLPGGGGGGLNSPSRRRLPEPATSLVSSFFSPDQPLLTEDLTFVIHSRDVRETLV